MKKLCLIPLFLLMGCSVSSSNLKTKLVDIDQLSLGETEDSWREFCSPSIREDETTNEWIDRMNGLCEPFEVLHKEWQKDFENLILSQDEKGNIQQGVLLLSGEKHDLLNQELEKSFQLTEKIRKQSEKNLENACTVCQQKQKLQARCNTECR